MLVLDTSVVSALMRREPFALTALSAHPPDTVLLCAPVAAEIRFGLERIDAGSRRQRLLEGEYTRLRAAVGWADWTKPAALAFGRTKAALEGAGTPLDDLDLVIASIALVAGAAVATRNARPFTRVPGLTVENWGG